MHVCSEMLSLILFPLLPPLAIIVLVIVHLMIIASPALPFVLGRQANLKESSESKEIAELRLQVLEVGKQVMLVNPKRKL